MRSERKFTVTIAALVSAAVLVAGCGGGGSSSSSESSATANPAKTTTSQGATTSVSSGAEPSKEFVGKGPDGKLAGYGKEASAAEREAASQVLEESMRARAAADWKGQCETLVKPLVEKIEGSGSVVGASGCAKALEVQAKPVPASARANTMTGPIDAFRIGFNRGFAFYHGTKGKDYVIPMYKEGGKWKVAALTTQEAP
jgi:hypothetical protein